MILCLLRVNVRRQGQVYHDAGNASVFGQRGQHGIKFRLRDVIPKFMKFILHAGLGKGAGLIISINAGGRGTADQNRGQAYGPIHRLQGLNVAGNLLSDLCSQ